MCSGAVEALSFFNCKDKLAVYNTIVAIVTAQRLAVF